MKRRLIIARHGNTFKPSETPTRVGARTDLPLVESGRGRSIGRYLKDNNLTPDVVYASPLLRAMQTAELAIEEMGIETKIIELVDFVEIDYGPDENKIEEDVLFRLGGGDLERGQVIIDAWNKDATVPDGWLVDPEEVIQTWANFAKNEATKYQTTLLVTSNGVIRFAPYLTGDFDEFIQEYDIKVTTGGICIFEKEDSDSFWSCVAWNLKPYKTVSLK